jgi:hypothetical protein
MCPTVYGRVQTRWAILIMPAIIATIISLITNNPGWIILIGVYFVIGVALDTCFYSFIIRWQPPWLTFTLAAGEFAIVYVVGKVLHVSLTPLEAILLFWLAWWLAIWTKVVILPLISLSWIEDAGEFRSTAWSLAPDFVPLPVTAFPAQPSTSGPPPLARKFSAAVIEIPEELRRAPSPSGVFQIPTDLPPKK